MLHLLKKKPTQTIKIMKIILKNKKKKKERERKKYNNNISTHDCAMQLNFLNKNKKTNNNNNNMINKSNKQLLFDS